MGKDSSGEAPLDGIVKLADEIQGRLKQLGQKCGDADSNFPDLLSEVQDELVRLRAWIKISEKNLHKDTQWGRKHPNARIREILSRTSQSEDEVKSLRDRHMFLISLRKEKSKPQGLSAEKEMLIGIQEDALLEQGYQLGELEKSILKQKYAGKVISEELDRHNDVIDDISRHAQNVGHSVQEGNQEFAEKSLLSKCSDYYLISIIIGELILLGTILRIS